MTGTCKHYIGRLAIFAVLALAATPALAEYGLNMPEGVTPFSRDVYWLHMLIFWICVAIGVVVFGAMVVSMFLHRKSRGATPAKFQHNTKLEAVWTTIPFVILVLMAIPATKTLIAMETTSGYEMTVKVTGYQWKWQYEYVDEGVSFMSSLDADSNRVRRLNSGEDPSSVENYLLDVDNPLVLPVDTKVRFLITSGDVIHSWWVPALGWKRDAIPGYLNEAWTRIDEEGTYRGQCAELCGKDHGFMPVVVKAVSKDEYRDWVASQPKTGGIALANEADAAAPSGTGADAAEAQAAEAVPTTAADEGASQPGPETAKSTADAEAATAAADDGGWTLEAAKTRGEEVYNVNCAACHQPNGQGMPPAFPSLVESQIVAGPVEGHLNNVVNGVPGTAMQPFGNRLSDEDIAAVVTYERNAWGLESGDLVTPGDVASFKGQ